MKKTLTLIVTSIFGGLIALGTNKYFIENTQHNVIENKTETPATIPVNMSTTNTNLTHLQKNVDFTVAAEKTLNTVVHVKNTTTSKGYTTYEDLFYGRQSQRQQVGTGSGVVISPDGLIITNNHVIDGAQSISITTNNNKTYEAELIGTDPNTDIALLKIETDEELPYTTFGDSNDAKIGEWVLAVGNPFNLTSTVTAGIISAKSRDLEGGPIQSFIQTDAAVNPGNSGGALVNTNGELIGINTAITSQTGSYIGYSFAVPSNIAKKVIEDILEFGNVQNGILGVTGGALDSTQAKELDINETQGFHVNTVQKNSGAEKAGIQSGDIIKKINNTIISKFSDLKGFLSTKGPNDVVDVTILRDGQEITLPVTLAKLDFVNVPIIGTLKETDAQDLNRFDIDYGLKISSLNSKIAQEWKADGVDKGSIVTAINGIKVNSIEDVNQTLSKYDNKVYSIAIIKNNGEKVNYRFR
ncbi:MAG: trypsin-like peptidase domain-containing protein [Flavobacteriaceae bacterium]|nr:trypsin-like peptidase domain-containing protein [Flavobacteriaceae bacterium]